MRSSDIFDDQNDLYNHSDKDSARRNATANPVRDILKCLPDWARVGSINLMSPTTIVIYGSRPWARVLSS